MKIRFESFLLLVAASLLAMLTASCRRDEPAPVRSAPPPVTTDANYDVKFLDTMAHHHGHAIKIWELAAERAVHPELRQYAERAIAEQKREIVLIDIWRDRWWKNVPRIPGHQDEAPEMTSHLKAARGPTFDAVFLAMMIPHHQRAAAMAGDAVRNAEMPEVRELAQIIVNQQEDEVAIMSGWQKAWFPESSDDAVGGASTDRGGERR